MAEYAVIERRRMFDRDTATQLVGDLVPEPPPESVIHEPTIVIDPDLGEPVLAYLQLPAPEQARLTSAVLAVHDFTGVARQGKLRSLSRTFGMAPRRPVMQHDACRITQLARDMPDVHAVFANLSLTLGGMLRGFAPQIVERDERTIAAVADDWRMAEGALWTSGVINHTAQLPYHRDGMNFDAWSAMPVVRSGVSGGYLHIPEYNLTPSCRNGFAVFFNGWRLVHGVTPITHIRKGRRAPKSAPVATTGAGYRFSVVYYALRGMKDCYSFAAEQEFGRAKRTEREANQAAIVRGERQWQVPAR